MTVNELLKRARSALGKKVKYRLGAGGIDPKSPTPASVDNACDCSGFRLLVLGHIPQDRPPALCSVQRRLDQH
jgi:hypothetical protein